MQMGVGAVFVSTLALTRLPTPQSPPQGQAELLAATMQTIVSFVVLGSIIIHGLSIPFFSLGKNMRSRTVSVSRTWTSRGTTAPDWLLGARRVAGTPAQDTTRPGTPDLEEVERVVGGEGHVRERVTEVQTADGPFVSRSVSAHSLRPGTPMETERLGSPRAMLRDITSSVNSSQVRVDSDRDRDLDKSEKLIESELRTPKSVHFPHHDREDSVRVAVTTEEGRISPGPGSGAQTPNKSVRFPPELHERDDGGGVGGERSSGGADPPGVEVQQKTVRFPASQ